MVPWEKRTRATLQNKSSPLLIHEDLDDGHRNEIVKENSTISDYPSFFEYKTFRVNMDEHFSCMQMSLLHRCTIFEMIKNNISKNFFFDMKIIFPIIFILSLNSLKTMRDRIRSMATAVFFLFECLFLFFFSFFFLVGYYSRIAYVARYATSPH